MYLFLCTISKEYHQDEIDDMEAISIWVDRGSHDRPSDQAAVDIQSATPKQQFQHIRCHRHHVTVVAYTLALPCNSLRRSTQRLVGPYVVIGIWS